MNVREDDLSKLFNFNKLPCGKVFADNIRRHFS